MKASLSPRAQATLQNLLFLAPPLAFGTWACLFFRLYSSQELVNLQSPRFHLYTLGAALILLALAVTYPLVFKPQTPLSVPLLPFLIRKGFVLLWLLLPAAAYLILPPAFSTPAALLDRVWASAATSNPSSGGRVDPAAVRSFILNSDPHLPLSLTPVDLQIVQSEAELQQFLKDRQVELLGQWLPLENAKPNEFRLVRLVMVCCAADARPAGIVTRGIVANPVSGNWYTASGTLDFSDPEKPIIFQAESVEPVDAPEEIFLY